MCFINAYCHLAAGFWSYSLYKFISSVPTRGISHSGIGASLDNFMVISGSVNDTWVVILSLFIKKSNSPCRMCCPLMIKPTDTRCESACLHACFLVVAFINVEWLQCKLMFDIPGWIPVGRLKEHPWLWRLLLRLLQCNYSEEIYLTMAVSKMLLETRAMKK